jgi:hypothetical protein
MFAGRSRQFIELSSPSQIFSDAALVHSPRHRQLSFKPLAGFLMRRLRFPGSKFGTPAQGVMFYFATFKVQVVPAAQRLFSTIN